MFSRLVRAPAASEEKGANLIRRLNTALLLIKREDKGFLAACVMVSRLDLVRRVVI